MVKWADYLISAVRYKDDIINAVLTRVDNDGDSVARATTIISRQNLIHYLEQGKTFVTIYKNGAWKKGEDISVHEVNGHKYVKTNPNNTQDDNLGKLGSF